MDRLLVAPGFKEDLYYYLLQLPCQSRWLSCSMEFPKLDRPFFTWIHLPQQIMAWDHCLCFLFTHL